jgi:hypothetical protein
MQPAVDEMKIGRRNVLVDEIRMCSTSISGNPYATAQMLAKPGKKGFLWV